MAEVILTVLPHPVQEQVSESFITFQRVKSHALVPVSYTHLDVYKRQALSVESTLVGMTGNAVFIESDEHGVVILLCLIFGQSVSYTHLDVYKRQVQHHGIL